MDVTDDRFEQDAFGVVIWYETEITAPRNPELRVEQTQRGRAGRRNGDHSEQDSRPPFGLQLQSGGVFV